ncbi:hypothetical protein NDU88_004402 [Pleurodeles waltl]|uniref:Uncharacterized protein n=1 Tax=Pleurodeles waltl TaxID=8319 RepID=A0AAV7LI42_PLEWA|nr:hypothetical protein NDU88_004402 [Pleurodeles waltl]
MDAIQALRNNIEPKIDASTLDVNLLCANLCKVTDKVATAEVQIYGLQICGLQAVNKQLEKQVQDLTKKQAEMEMKLEDQEGRARCNIRNTGIPEGTVQNCSWKTLS